MERFRMDDGLAREVCARLGVTLPGDLDGVAALYQRWCAQIPFDGVAKALALREGRTPPGADPTEFCERWFTTGLGGTCWGHVAGLSAVLGSAGASTRVALDRMHRDDALDFHGFVLLEDEGRLLALDVIHVTGVPLSVDDGARGTHPLYRTGFDAEAGRLVHWFDSPATWQAGGGRYALLSTDLDARDVEAFCELSARFSGVRAHRYFHRRTPPHALVKGGPVEDGSAYRISTWSVDGPPGVWESRDRDEVFAALGVTPAGARLVEAAGLVDGRDPARPFSV